VRGAASRPLVEYVGKQRVFCDASLDGGRKLRTALVELVHGLQRPQKIDVRDAVVLGILAVLAGRYYLSPGILPRVGSFKRQDTTARLDVRLARIGRRRSLRSLLRDFANTQKTQSGGVECRGPQ
jgi:hypothetical protein